MKTKTIAYLAMVVASSIPATFLQTQAASLAPVSVGAVGAGSANNWPLYIAMTEGLFKKDGLDVTYISVPVGSAVQQQLVAGSIDIGSSGTVDPLRAIGSGAPITMLSIQVAKAPYYIIAKPTIHSMAELKNKTVMLDGPKEINHYYFQRMAQGEGLNPADCDIIYAGATSARLAALLSGSVDATIINPPYTFLAQAKGFKALPVPADFAKGLPFESFAVNLKWGESHKQLVRSFLDAYADGVAWFYDPANKKEALSILLKRVKMTPGDAEKTYDMYMKEKFFVQKKTIEKDDLQDEIDALKKDGSLSGSTDFSRFYKLELLGLSK